MIHKLHDKKHIARQKKITQTIIWVVVFILASVGGALAGSGRFFTFIGRPIWHAQETLVTSAENATVIVRTKASVFAENEQLAKENVELKNAMIDYQILKKENDDLKELMGRLPTNQKFILATILSKPNRSPYDTIIVDAGADLGVKEGDHVYANAQTPIGEVDKVYASASLVMLYSNPGQTTEGVLDGSNASVQLLGRGGGNFEMTVPLELSIQKGTAVVLPGNSPHILALIEEVISAPSDPLKKVILRTPVNIQNLKWVQIQK